MLHTLYKTHFGKAPHKSSPLAKAGSNRQYFRLEDEQGASVIGVIGTDVTENRCFVYLCQHFYDKGLPVPKILACAEDYSCYLQTDLGTVSLYDALKRGRESAEGYNAEDRAMIAKSLRQLARLQVIGAQGLDFDRLLSPTHFTPQAAMFDFNYFKYCFLRTTDVAFDEVKLQRDMEQMAADLTKAETPYSTFLYRDYQARNVMLSSEGEPYFIDFQGGKCGPLQYDIASFLWQASAKYSAELRAEMIEEYLDELSSLVVVDKKAFIEKLNLFVLFRTLQVLGAYGLRGYFERKQYFLDSIPHAIANLRQSLDAKVCAPYPHLEQTLYKLVNLPQFMTKEKDNGQMSKSAYDGQGPLVVRIFSFSYKKGIPTDESGNGGGYVFDCRSTHNPGRYEPYKKLTGLDLPVIDFLEDDGEILTFLEHIYPLAEAHVARYIQRGFTNLMFSFGCTGGQHRSVYSAQHLAEFIHQKFGIEVRICHREQGITQTLQAK